MTSSNHRYGRRVLATAAAAALAITTMLVTSSSPAYAHTRSTAIQYGCGSNYNYISNTQVSVVSRTSSVVYGYVALARKFSTGTTIYCAVVWKRATHSGHGVGTKMVVRIGIDGQSRTCNSCKHWESLHFTLGSSVFFSYGGDIYHPTPGYWARGSGSWSIYD